MRKRIYADTSVIGGCFDEEFKKVSEILVNLGWPFQNLVDSDNGTTGNLGPSLQVETLSQQKVLETKSTS